MISTIFTDIASLAICIAAPTAVVLLCWALMGV